MKDVPMTMTRPTTVKLSTTRPSRPIFGLGLAFVFASVSLIATSNAVLAAQAPTPAPAAATPAPASDVAKAGDHFGDWVFECAALAEGQTLCSLNQTLVTKEKNQVIARFSLSRDKKTNEIVFGTMVPLGIDIPAGIVVSFDQNQPVQLTILTCTQNGCIANTNVNAKMFDTMKNGKALAVQFKFRGAEKPTVFNGSLNGLGAGALAAGLK